MARGTRSGRRGVPGPVVRTAGDHVLEVVAERGDPDVRVLRIDGQVHGAVDLRDPRRLPVDYQDRAVRAIHAVLPPGRPLRAVHLGGGPCAIPRALAASGPHVDQEVVERSAAVVRIAREVTGLRPGPALRVRTGDARRLLARRPDASAELVVADVFDGVSTPAHLRTLELHRDLVRVLAPGGLLVANLVDQPPHGRARAAVAAAAAALGRTASQAIALAADRRVLDGRAAGNLLLLARRDAALPLDRLTERLAGGRHPWALRAGDALRAFVAGAVPERDEGEPDAAPAAGADATPAAAGGDVPPTAVADVGGSPA